MLDNDATDSLNATGNDGGLLSMSREWIYCIHVRKYFGQLYHHIDPILQYSKVEDLMVSAPFTCSSISDALFVSAS